MKRFKNSLIVGLSLLSLSSYSQYFDYNDYDWEEDRAPFSEQVDDSTSVIILKEKRVYNFHYLEDNSLAMDRLFHRRVYLNSTRSLENYNKMYIPTGEGNELLSFRARAIINGKTIEIDSDDIQTGQVEDSEEEYNYFAFEGLEVGAEVEYYYINRRPPVTSGLLITAQTEYETKDFELDFITPGNLIYDFKLYNLNDTIRTDTTLEEENRWYYKSAIPAFKEEEMSPDDALIGKMIFKLDINTYSGDKDITSYNYSAQNIISFISQEKDKGALKAVAKEAKAAAKYLITEEPDLPLAFRIENYLKDNYNFIDASAAQLLDLEFVRENKIYNDAGGLLLYSGLFEEMGVAYKLVYTCNRNDLIFDEDFEASNFLQDILFYIPEIDEYMDPSDATSRNGVINFMYTAQKGLFMEKEELAGEFVALAEVDEIAFKPRLYTSDTIKVAVEFGPDLLENDLKVYRSLSGYSARSYQGIFHLIADEDALKEVQESLLGYLDMEATVENQEIINADVVKLGRAPLMSSGTLTDANYIESAGSDLLLNVGKLIGPQSAMYDEDSLRLNDVYNSYGHNYYREIRFTIPEGFRMVDPEKMNFNKTLVLDGETKALFTSTYSVTGKDVTVFVKEWYDGAKYPKEAFQEYLSVINAAADFNKVSVLLEQEK